MMITIYSVEQHVSTTTATHTAQTKKKANDTSRSHSSTNTISMNVHTTIDAHVKIDNAKNTSSRKSNIEKQDFITKLLIETFVEMSNVLIINNPSKSQF